MRITTFNISLENSAQDLLTLVFVDGELPSNILIRPDNIIITCVFNTLQASEAFNYYLIMVLPASGVQI